jgi:CubicO group peptidase (beta-lactamase class C family)
MRRLANSEVASVRFSGEEMKTMHCLTACAILLAVFSGVPRSAPARADSADASIETYIQAEMARQWIPGLSLGVMRDGKIIKAKGYGLANVELDVPVKPESIFQTGSVGKQFTSMAVMMLVEEGRVRLDDKVSVYFPDAPAAWKQITVRNLLTHTSGIHDYESENSIKPGGPINMRQDYTENELYQKIAAMPLDFQPGEKWQYSNSGYVLLGFLIHKVTGEFYGDFLHERIFQPLGMTATRIISEADIVPNRCAGYALVDGVLKNQQWVSPTMNTTADGALYTDVPDMAKWDAALYTEKLVKKSSLDQIWTPVKLNNGKTFPYGFGWDLTEVNDHRLIEHGGAWQGFSTQISRYVDDRLTVVVLTNLDSGHSDPEKIAHDVAAIYLPAVKPPALAPVSGVDPKLTALLRSAIQKLAAGNADPQMFASELSGALFPDGAAGLRKELKTDGALQTLVPVGLRKETGPTGDLVEVYTYRAKFERKTMDVVVATDADGKISAFGLEPD